MRRHAGDIAKRQQTRFLHIVAPLDEVTSEGWSAAVCRVRIETVDSFQGKQLDVIIFSCVRATGANGALYPDPVLKPHL